LIDSGQFIAQCIAQRFQMRTSCPGVAQSRLRQIERQRQRIALGLKLRGSAVSRKPTALEQIGLRIFGQVETAHQVLPLSDCCRRILHSEDDNWWIVPAPAMSRPAQWK
jgi:hypothetical protein